LSLALDYSGIHSSIALFILSLSERSLGFQSDKCSPAWKGLGISGGLSLRLVALGSVSLAFRLRPERTASATRKV